MTLSPASVRNVMSDLESLGLIYAPHTSAGRLPTQTGLRLFIDGLLEVGDISVEERSQIESRIAGSGRRRAVEDVLGEAGEMLSGLSRCAGVVLVDKQSKKLKHVEFVNLGPGRALAVLVGDDGDVENRIITLPEGLPSSRYVALRVVGDSMTPLLHSGDVVLVDLDRQVPPGAVAVARHPDHGSVVKRLVRTDGDRWRLVSLNPAYPPLELPPDSGTLLGPVVLRWCVHSGNVARQAKPRLAPGP